MLILRDPASVAGISDPGMRSLVRTRFEQVCDGEVWDRDLHGSMIVVEPGDGAAELERESGCPILHDPYEDTRFGNPDFAPSFEALEEHDGCYEMVFIFSDGGAGVAIFIPRLPGVDAELLAMCAAYAVPAPGRAPP